MICDASGSCVNRFTEFQVPSAPVTHEITNGPTVSPPATEGPGITGIAGTQVPTRWHRSGSSP
jgi:hypothetical protein